MNLVTFAHLKEVKNIITKYSYAHDTPLKTIKEALIDAGHKQISYFDIKVALALLDKKDV